VRIRLNRAREGFHEINLQEEGIMNVFVVQKSELFRGNVLERMGLRCTTIIFWR